MRIRTTFLDRDPSPSAVWNSDPHFFLHQNSAHLKYFLHNCHFSAALKELVQQTVVYESALTFEIRIRMLHYAVNIQIRNYYFSSRATQPVFFNSQCHFSASNKFAVSGLLFSSNFSNESVNQISQVKKCKSPASENWTDWSCFFTIWPKFWFSTVGNCLLQQNFLDGLFYTRYLIFPSTFSHRYLANPAHAKDKQIYIFDPFFFCYLEFRRHQTSLTGLFYPAI